MTHASGDPKPLPPSRPDPEDCCRSGCQPCVFDLYDADLRRYQRELAKWEARASHQQSKKSGRKNA